MAKLLNNGIGKMRHAAPDRTVEGSQGNRGLRYAVEPIDTVMIAENQVVHDFLLLPVHRPGSWRMPVGGSIPLNQAYGRKKQVIVPASLQTVF